MVFPVPVVWRHAGINYHRSGKQVAGLRTSMMEQWKSNSTDRAPNWSKEIEDTTDQLKRIWYTWIKVQITVCQIWKQVHWEHKDAFVTAVLQEWMGAILCAVVEVITRTKQQSRKGASVSFTGAAMWNVKHARDKWMCIHVNNWYGLMHIIIVLSLKY